MIVGFVPVLVGESVEALESELLFIEKVDQQTAKLGQRLQAYAPPSLLPC
jgi:hypothetical protein